MLNRHTPAEGGCDWLEYSRVSPGEMTALLDYTTDSTAKLTELHKLLNDANDQDCSCIQVYDEYQVVYMYCFTHWRLQVETEL